MSLDLSRLTNVKATATGWTAQCPLCAAQGRDLKGRDHLGILRSGAFHCVLCSDAPGANANIRALARGDAVTDIEYIDPEPRLTTERVYPESSLTTLLPDYSYWLKRGMKEEVLKALENGLAPQGEKGKLSGRSVFPIRDAQRRIVGFSGRLTGESSFAPKWKHLFRSGKAVYPAHLTGEAIRLTRTAVLHESLGDGLALLSHDIKPILCTWGLNLSGAIISYLVSADVRCVFCSPNRDADPRKGQAAAERWADRLSDFVPKVVIRLPEPPFEDWGECAEGGEAGAAELARFRAEVEAS